MNRTIEKLQAAYVVRFVGTAVCVAGSIGAWRLILLGKTGDNFVPGTSPGKAPPICADAGSSSSN
jgi:hypothetical protein